NMWKELFEDPSFVETYQKSMNDEQKELFKSLMHDAAFQNQMLDLLQNPEISNQMLIVLKGQQFREHLEETIQETLETPLFQSNIKKLVLEGTEIEQTKEEKKEDIKEYNDEENKKENSEKTQEEYDKEDLENEGLLRITCHLLR